jgi:hypothetical protein
MGWNKLIVFYLPRRHGGAEKINVMANKAFSVADSMVLERTAPTRLGAAAIVAVVPLCGI